MASLDTVRSFLTEEHGLAVVSTVQADGAVLSSVVNCGAIGHRARTAVLITPACIRGNG